MVDYEAAIRREMASIKKVQWAANALPNAMDSSIRFCERVIEYVDDAEQAWRIVRSENASLRGIIFEAQTRKIENDFLMHFCDGGNPHHVTRVQKDGANCAVCASNARAIIEITVLAGGILQSCICPIAHDGARLWGLRDELARRPVMAWDGAL